MKRCVHVVAAMAAIMLSAGAAGAQEKLKVGVIVTLSGTVKLF